MVLVAGKQAQLDGQDGDQDDADDEPGNGVADDGADLDHPVHPAALDRCGDAEECGDDSDQDHGGEAPWSWSPGIRRGERVGHGFGGEPGCTEVSLRALVSPAEVARRGGAGRAPARLPSRPAAPAWPGRPGCSGRCCRWRCTAGKDEDRDGKQDDESAAEAFEDERDHGGSIDCMDWLPVRQPTVGGCRTRAGFVGRGRILGGRVVVDGRNGLLDLRRHGDLRVVVVHLVHPEQRGEPCLLHHVLVDFLGQLAGIGAAGSARRRSWPAARASCS